MKKYLSEIHKKPEAHKKRFALAVSGGFTLLMLMTWSVVSFGGEPELARDTTGTVNLAAASQSGVSPFENVLDGIIDTWGSLSDLIKHGR